MDSCGNDRFPGHELIYCRQWSVAPQMSARLSENAATATCAPAPLAPTLLVIAANMHQISLDIMASQSKEGREVFIIKKELVQSCTSMAPLGSRPGFAGSHSTTAPQYCSAPSLLAMQAAQLPAMSGNSRRTLPTPGYFGFATSGPPSGPAPGL